MPAAFFGLWGSSRPKAGRNKPDPIWSVQTGAFCLSKDEKTPHLSPDEFMKRIRRLDGNCCGEDSYSIAENDYQMVIAVADGVGGWRKKGIDPARFSRCLMAQATKAVELCDEEPLQPKEILRRAFYGLIDKYLRREGDPPFGSSTACIVSLGRGTGELEVANLGDSGVMVIREGGVLFRSESQQTRFNAPYQATLRPNGDVDDMTPMAAESTLPVQPGDIIVLGTDGLWDNLWEADVKNFVADRAYGSNLGVLAKDLVMRARKASESPEDSPFAAEARKAGKSYSGGKPDDITAIIAVVVKSANGEERV